MSGSQRGSQSKENGAMKHQSPGLKKKSRKEEEEEEEPILRRESSRRKAKEQSKV